jgi:hypothetical protein
MNQEKIVILLFLSYSSIFMGDDDDHQYQMPKSAKPNLWIQNAVKKPGSFTAYCKSHGKKGVTAACIKEGMHSPNRLTEERANFANVMRGIQKKHHR